PSLRAFVPPCLRAFPPLRRLHSNIRISELIRHPDFAIRICFGFRVSDFGFLYHSLSQIAATRPPTIMPPGWVTAPRFGCGSVSSISQQHAGKGATSNGGGTASHSRHQLARNVFVHPSLPSLPNRHPPLQAGAGPPRPHPHLPQWPDP